jgi:DNA polymerase III subunit gamma/tau
MSYTVLARKYRPQTFEELVGQEHVAKTLGNAIASGRVAHAFLFTGVRGVGKTSAARLLAKSLNCENGPSTSPCNACDICKDVTAGRDVDVLEIDGASNNGVDDVRRLQETLPYRPQRARFKVVIVDEVHMLSTAAFNAFLKTLEEPPAHVKFIFATTEVHKVPITIRSRCQRYDFRLIPQAIIAGRVRDILGREGISADDDTVAIVAREAAGSMRDALTLLDQVVALGGNELVGVEVAESLGIAGRAEVRAVVESLVRGVARPILERIREVAQKGLDTNHFARQLVAFARDLVVLRITDDPRALVDLVPDEEAFAADLAHAVDVLELQRLFAGLTRLQDEVARASSPHLALEMGLVRLATRPALHAVADLVARLEALEGRAAGGGSAPREGRGASTPTSSTERATPARSAPEEHARASEPERPRSEPERPRSEPERDSQVSSSLTAGAKAALSLTRGMRERRSSSTQGASADEPNEEPPAASAPPMEPSGPRLRKSTLKAWSELVDAVRANGHESVAAVLEQAEPQVVREDKIVLLYPEGSFFGRQASETLALSALREAAARVLHASPVIEIRDVESIDADKTLAALGEHRKRSESDRRRREALEHPRVLDALDVFPEARGHVEVALEGEP